MVTKFDVGDVIQFEVVGRIVSYSCSENYDCYGIEVCDNEGEHDGNLRLYINSEQLEECHAVKVELNERKENK